MKDLIQMIQLVPVIVCIVSEQSTYNAVISPHPHICSTERFQEMFSTYV